MHTAIGIFRNKNASGSIIETESGEEVFVSGRDGANALPGDRVRIRIFKAAA